MTKYIYPAVFDSDADGSEGYTITSPDLPGCSSEGTDIQNALYMAKDVLKGFMYALEEDSFIIPALSNPNTVKVPASGFVALIEA